MQRDDPLVLPLTTLTGHPCSAATAHFSFCRTLLEHTVSAESIPCHLPRTPGTSLTWHDSRSQRAAGGRPVKLLQQPGTEAPQVPTHHTHLSPCPSHHLTAAATHLLHRAGCTRTTMACTTQAPPWAAWQGLWSCGVSRTCASGSRSTVPTTTSSTWRPSPSTPSQVPLGAGLGWGRKDPPPPACPCPLSVSS